MGRLKWDWLATLADDDEIAAHEEWLKSHPEPIPEIRAMTRHEQLVNTVFSLGILDDLRDLDARDDEELFHRRLWERLTPGHLRSLLTGFGSDMNTDGSVPQPTADDADCTEKLIDLTSLDSGRAPFNLELPMPPHRKPVVFVECSRGLSQEVMECITATWKQRYGDRYDLCLLDSNLKLANQQSWRPEQIDIQCGQISIRSGTGGTIKGSTVTVDGQEMKNVRRIAFELTPHNVPLVNIEFVAKPFKADHA